MSILHQAMEIAKVWVRYGEIEESRKEGLVAGETVAHLLLEKHGEGGLTLLPLTSGACCHLV